MTPGAIKTRVSAWAADARANPLFAPALAGAAFAAILDQASKAYIVEVVRLPMRRHIDISAVFDLTFVRNQGASFGMLAGGTASRIVLSMLSLVIVGALLTWLARLNRPIAAAGVALIIGGALGNLYDRVTLGYVVDFLDFSGLYFPWVFNVADVCINLGIACLVIDALKEKRGGSAAS